MPASGSRLGNQADRPDAVSRYLVYSAASTRQLTPFSTLPPVPPDPAGSGYSRTSGSAWRNSASARGNVKRRGDHDQRTDPVLLRPGRGLDAIAAGRGSIAPHGDPIGEWSGVDPGQSPQRRQIAAAADTTQQQPIRPARGQQTKRQLHPPGPAGQRHDAVGMRRRLECALCDVDEPDQPAGPARRPPPRQPRPAPATESRQPPQPPADRTMRCRIPDPAALIGRHGNANHSDAGNVPSTAPSESSVAAVSPANGAARCARVIRIGSATNEPAVAAGRRQQRRPPGKPTGDIAVGRAQAMHDLDRLPPRRQPGSRRHRDHRRSHAGYQQQRQPRTRLQAARQHRQPSDPDPMVLDQSPRRPRHSTGATADPDRYRSRSAAPRSPPGSESPDARRPDRARAAAGRSTPGRTMHGPRPRPASRSAAQRGRQPSLIAVPRQIARLRHLYRQRRPPLPAASAATAPPVRTSQPAPAPPETPWPRPTAATSDPTAPVADPVRRNRTDAAISQRVLIALGQPAIGDMQRRRRMPLDQRLIMRGDDHRGADSVHFLEQLHQPLRLAVIQVPGRLICQQQCRPG